MCKNILRIKTKLSSSVDFLKKGCRKDNFAKNMKTFMIFLADFQILSHGITTHVVILNLLNYKILTKRKN
eukprot:UN24003